MRDFLQKWKVECRADGLVPLRFAIFPLHLSKVLRLPRKINARSYEVLHPSRKIILANLHIWYSKMQPLSGNQRPDLRTSLMNMSFVLRLPRKMHLCRSSSNVPCLPSFLEMLQNPHVLLTFEEVHNPLRLPHETTSEPPKVARACGALYILTWKCASRHSGVHFSSLIWPAGSAPAALASLLGATNHWKKTVFRDFPTVPFRAPGSSFFWDFLFSDLLSYSLLFSDSSHLCFSSVNIVGSLTSKLPSMICTYSLCSLSNFKAFVCVCVCNIDPSPTHVHFFRQSFEHKVGTSPSSLHSERLVLQRQRLRGTSTNRITPSFKLGNNFRLIFQPIAKGQGWKGKRCFTNSHKLLYDVSQLRCEEKRSCRTSQPPSRRNSDLFRSLVLDSKTLNWGF